jgi:hypothetical protein
VGTGVSWGSKPLDFSPIPIKSAKKWIDLFIEKSKLCWHDPIVGVDFFRRDLTSLAGRVTLNLNDVRPGDRVLFLSLGAVYTAVLRPGRLGGILGWKRCEDICYEEGCTIAVEKGTYKGTKFCFSEGVWMSITDNGE